MGKPTGFLEVERHDRSYAPVEERIGHYSEFLRDLAEEEVVEQASRCMDCGIPFCHTGCPVNNQIPDWNDLVYHNDWREACNNLHSTNNFPEFTGRICPAPCEESCTLNIDDVPVTIKTVECAIVDKGFREGWITPQIAATKTGKKIAIIGAGPAGLAAAQQLARAGHDVHLFERNARAGGLLRYGIPDYKLDKSLIDTRVTQMEAEGVTFHYNANVGVTIAAKDIERDHDAVLLTGGAEDPNNFFHKTSGSNLKGIHFAMDFLPQQNRRNGEEPLADVEPILATGKHVIVIGGGDTGSDCIGTSIRQKALSVTQLEITQEPPAKVNKGMTWPDWPNKRRISSSQAEGATCHFGVNTISFEGDEDGNVTAVRTIKVDPQFKSIEGTERTFEAGLVLFATGFGGPLTSGMLDELELQPVRAVIGMGVEANDKNYLVAGHEALYAAGDMRRGQSLVVWAIREGRQAAQAIDEFLMGESLLPR